MNANSRNVQGAATVMFAGDTF